MQDNNNGFRYDQNDQSDNEFETEEHWLVSAFRMLLVICLAAVIVALTVRLIMWIVG